MIMRVPTASTTGINYIVQRVARYGRSTSTKSLTQGSFFAWWWAPCGARNDCRRIQQTDKPSTTHDVRTHPDTTHGMARVATYAAMQLAKCVNFLHEISNVLTILSISSHELALRVSLRKLQFVTTISAPKLTTLRRFINQLIIIIIILAHEHKTVVTKY